MILLRWLAFKPAQGEGLDRPKAEGPAAVRPAGPSIPATSSAVDSAVQATGPAPAVAQASSEPAAQGFVPSAAAPSAGHPEQSVRPPASVASAPARPVPAAPVPAELPKPMATPVVAPVAAPVPAPAPVSAQPPVSAPRQEQTPPWDDDIPVADDEPSYMRDVPFDLPEDTRSPAPQRIEPERLVPAVPAAPPALQRTVVPVVQTTPLGDRWADLVNRMQQEGLLAALVRELAMQAECVDVKEAGAASVWHLRVERETLRSDAQRERLTNAVRKILGDGADIELEAGVAKDTPALREQAARAGRQAAAETLIQQDPLINALLSQYPGARIVNGSIAPL